MDAHREGQAVTARDLRGAWHGFGPISLIRAWVTDASGGHPMWQLNIAAQHQGAPGIAVRPRLGSDTRRLRRARGARRR